MALPTNLANKIKSIPIDPALIATDLELAYLLSFSKYPASLDSIYSYPRDVIHSPLQNYQYVDFEDHVYDQLLEETNKNYKNRSKQAVQGIRCGFKEFYTRVAAITYNSAFKYFQKQKHHVDKIPTLPKEEEEFKIQSIKGNLPGKWPDNLKEFNQELSALPWNAFSTDSEHIYTDFIESIKNAILSHCKKIKPGSQRLDENSKEILLKELEALIGVALRTNNQPFILLQLKFITQLSKSALKISHEDQHEITDRLSNFIKTYFNLIQHSDEKTSTLHHNENLWNKESFLILKKINFQRNNGLLFNSVTTDGTYLYLYISAINGGMYKIGTGNNGSKAGKIYLERTMHTPIGTKADEISWIYFKGKLYLKMSIKDPWHLQVINPNTFKRQYSTQLICPSLFGQQSLINLNKNASLMTDGEKLYLLGSRIKIAKGEDEPRAQSSKQKIPEDLKVKNNLNQKKKRLKKGGKQVPNVVQQQKPQQNHHKILEIVLYEFDPSERKSYQKMEMNESEIQQLYDSFNGYYTLQECRRAYSLNNFDVNETCQWLFNEGEREKEKNIRMVEEEGFVILCECEITSNFQQKNIKQIGQITTKEGSILSINHIHEYNWTMDKEQITCYSDSGIKIFSKSMKHFKKNQENKLFSTLLKTITEHKFHKNPEYNMIYDPYNALFYTFAWPQEGHFLPAPILVSHDKKTTQNSYLQKKQSTEQLKPTKLHHLSKYTLSNICALKAESVANNYRFNDWLWFYGQRVIEISNQMNKPESDKKRLSNKRAKILTKMNKINEAERIYEKDKSQFARHGKIRKEIYKIYPFQADGTLQNIKLVRQSFQMISENPQEAYLFVLCLKNWLKNCPNHISEEIRQFLNQTGSYLFTLKALCSNKLKTLITNILITQFYLFFSTPENQIKFFTKLQKQQLQEFLTIHSFREISIENQSQNLYEYTVEKKQLLTQKYETKVEFAEIFKLKSIVTQQKNDKKYLQNLLSISNILLDTSPNNVKQKKILIQFLQNLLIDDVALGKKILEFMFLQCLKNISDEQSLKLKLQKQFEMFYYFFKIIEKTLHKIKSQFLKQICQVLIFITQIYFVSLSCLNAKAEINLSLIKILDLLQRSEFSDILNILQEIQYEGISAITQKNYQTAHPLERGKNYSFPPRSFSDASLIYVEFDKRCQSDQNHDIMTIQLLHEDSPIGNNIVFNDGNFYSNLKMTGVVDAKKPYLLFGNTVNMDVNSSGHAKDAQSFGRYGFKFQLRPVFAGKLKFNPKKKDIIQKQFKNVQNFQLFINTLKFLTVAASNSIQNNLFLQNHSTESKIDHILKGKVFRGGFQENSHKYQYLDQKIGFNKAEILFKNQKKQEKQKQTYQRQLIYQLHQNCFKTQNKLQNQKQKQKQKQKEENKALNNKVIEQRMDQIIENQQNSEKQLWNFDGVPSYIKGYLEQIKLFQGDFIDVFKEARENDAKQTGQYAQILRRKTFEEAQKRYWLQGQAILFLTVLKHSGLLQLNLKFSIEYIKQNLKAFEEARNGIFYAFISRMQIVQEWNDLIQTYWGRQEEVEEEMQIQKKQSSEKKNTTVKEISIKRKGKLIKTVKIGEQKSIPIEKKIEEKVKPQQINKAQAEKLIRERLSNNQYLVKNICELKKIKYSSENSFQNITRIIQEVSQGQSKSKEKCRSVYIEPIDHLIKSCLFLLKLKSASTRESLESNEDIVPVVMSRSLSSDNRHVNVNKVNLFRQWLENWKKWKGFRKEGKVQLKFPVLEIVQFVNSWIQIQTIQQIIDLRYTRCQNRTSFYSQTSSLLKITSNNFLSKYTLGSQAINLSTQYNSDLCSVPNSKIQLLNDSYKDFTLNLKQIQNNKLKKLPTSLGEFQSLLKVHGLKSIEKIRLIANQIFLLQSENPSINLSLILYFIPFKYLSNSSEDLVYISTLITQRGFLMEHSLEQILQNLKRQIGSNNVSCRRWKDYFFLERCLFLLRKTEHFIRSHKNIILPLKQSIAESLFYILFHIEVPIIHKLCWKIVKRLDIDLKATHIQTPLQVQYQLFTNTFAQGDSIQFYDKFHCTKFNKIVQAKHKSVGILSTFNNIDLLSCKIASIFKENEQLPQRSNCNQMESLKEALFKKISSSSINEENQISKNNQVQNRYNILLNLHQQEDLYWLIKVLYFLEELDKKTGEKINNLIEIKDWDQYTVLKNKKKDQNTSPNKKEEKKDPNQNNIDNNNTSKQKEKENQRIVSNIPQKITIQDGIEKQLPLGWFLNYCNVFNDPLDKSVSKSNTKESNKVVGNAHQNLMKNINNKKPNPNNNNNNNGNKKVWACPLYYKIAKKYEEFNSKPLEEPKDTDPLEAKIQYIKAKNFIHRIRRHLFEISNIIDNLTKNGYYLFREDISQKKMHQICQMINYGSCNKLKEIPLEYKNNELRNRLNLNENMASSVSKLKITVIKSQDYGLFQNLVSMQNALNIKSDFSNLYYTYLNKKELTLDDTNTYIPYEQFLIPDEPTEEENDQTHNRDVQFGKQWIENHFSNMKKRYQKVYLYDYPNDTYHLVQGGIQNGVKDVTLLSLHDPTLTLQTAIFQNVFTSPKNNNKEEETTEFPQDIIKKAFKIMERRSEIVIESKEQVQEYLLLSFYLQKLSKESLELLPKELITEFTNKISNFSKNLRSYKELSTYTQQTQKLILKLIDNSHQKLHLFQIYAPDDQVDLEIQSFVNLIALEKLNSSNQNKQEKIETHVYQKSVYNLKSQPPQIEQNKLLKYWEKNILPKIYQFVKTTLKPLEIQDFWEQMRIPLRKNDQKAAQQVAFVICDNKLPNGAVLPDANHNWNSFEIEEIFVGEHVLIRLPKNKWQSYSPLLSWGGQELRLAKIIFIDTKNLSVLVRYRVQELSIFSYTWVPVNSLLSVEKEVLHISTKNIYEELEKNIQGMIYIYSKECLTKLVSLSDANNIKLMKETILDLFIKNPISCCYEYPKPKWSMLPTLQKMMQQESAFEDVLQLLEKEFMSNVPSIDLNLYSEKVLQLNRFDDAKGLIVSFKKQSRISICSGLKFYSDKYCYSEVEHVYAPKSERSEIEPIQFQNPNIYCKYYTNKECLQASEQNRYKVYPIEVTVFAVNQMWVIGSYLGDVICDIVNSNQNNHPKIHQKKARFYITILGRINQVYLRFLSKRNVTVLCTYLSKLISKITSTITSLCFKYNIQPTLELINITPAQLKEILLWINKLQEEEEKDILSLYSSLLQNLSEMVTCILCKVNSENKQKQNNVLPEHIMAMIDLTRMFDQIDLSIRNCKNVNKNNNESLQAVDFPESNSPLKKQSSTVSNNPTLYHHWERMMLVKDIPAYLNYDHILEQIRNIIRDNKGKMLCPKYDVYTDSLQGIVILVDGWDVTELVEEEVIQKIQHEVEEQKQEEEQQAIMEWTCQACTFVNLLGSDVCEVCQGPPPAPKIVEVYDKVQKTDLDQAQKKLKLKEAKRFEQIKIQILELFQKQWKKYCENAERKNKLIEEENAKNREQNKKKKKGAVQIIEKQKIEIPKKPNINLSTGSDILNNKIAEDFFKWRFDVFPISIKKLVEFEETYVSKFKKLLSLGYDFWCDNIFNQNANLIPFSSLYLLMDYIQTQICKGSSSVLSYSQDSIRILSQIPILDDKNILPEEQPINYLSQNDVGVRVKYKSLAALKSYNIRYSWKIVKELNLAASKCLQFINMDLKYDKERSETYPLHYDCLGYKVKYFRNLIMGVIKLELTQKIIQKTSNLRENEEIPKICLERLRIREDRLHMKLVTVKQKDQHLVTKAHEQFLKVAPAFLRPFKPKGTDPYVSFSVTFKGELVMGEAGPYRQFFTDIAQQLEPGNNLGLFIPSPNNRYQEGENKSKWLVNPNANSTYHFSLFEFIGVLMGCCLRTGAHIALDLPTIFWKSITHEEINEADLEEVDSKFIAMIRLIKECPIEEALDQATNGQPLTWIYTTSDGQEHQIIPNGKNIRVQFKQLNKYIEMLKNRRITESKLQIKRIIKGLSNLIPLPYLNCLSADQIRLAICGRPKVDVELLKRHTKYALKLNEESRRIKYFWEVLHEMDEKDRLKLIRFCWGQERLPVNSEQYERNNIRFMIKPMIAQVNQDQALPKADTCFFNIELPDYSTKEIMRQKILLAINLDNVSINADDNFNQDDNPLMNDIDGYGNADDENYDEENGGG